MKKHFLITPALCVAALSAHAQFVTSAGNTTTNDRVGIGTSTPTFKLEVSGTTVANRTIGINTLPVVYLPDQNASLYMGSIAFGNGLRNLAPFASSNTAVGVDAGLSLTTGFLNTAVGHNALKTAAVNQINTAIGANALRDLNGGSYNVAVGSGCLIKTTSGHQNTAVGTNAMVNDLSGLGNTAMGHNVLYNNQSGAWNVAMGVHALHSNIGGYYNIGIGVRADVLKDNLMNAMAIGSYALVGKSNAISLGDTTKPTLVGIGTAYPDYMLDVRASANPVRLRGLQNGSLSDYVVTSDANGVLRRIPAAAFSMVTGAAQGVTLDGSTVTLGDYCGNGGGKFEKEREINLNDYALYFNSGEKGKLYMGVSSCQPLMTRLEISSKGLETKNEYDTKLASPSGLRFTDLTSNDTPIPNKTDGVLSLDADGDVIWVKACCDAARVQEMQNTVDQLNNTVANLQAELSELKVMMRQANPAAVAAHDELFQNVPNPSGSSTRIDYSLGAQSSEAFLVIYDMSGKLMTRLALDGRAGKSSVTVDMGGWAAGSYSYSLFVNGQMRDSKKMQVAH